MWFTGKLSRDQRGVGSVIGAVFVVLILLSGFTFYTLNVNTTEQYNKTLDLMRELDWNRDRETIVISEIRITGTNKLNVSVENEGPVQSHLILLGIFNKTVTPEIQRYDALEVYVQPGDTESIVSNFTVVKGKKYAIQLVTELGNVVEHKFYPASEVNCPLTLITAPPTTYEGNNITVLLTVTHNDTEVDTIQSLTVSLETEPAGLVEIEEEPTSLTVEALTRGETAFFRWIYNTTGVGTATFNATYQQAPVGTYALCTVVINSHPNIGEIAITGPDTIPWGENTEYTVRVTDDDEPVTNPATISIYINGSMITISYLSIPTLGTSVGGNPWLGIVELDTNGEFTFIFNSRVAGGDTFWIFIRIGMIVGAKQVVQEPH